MKVLVCAYACLKDPDNRFGQGGEAVLGWNLIKKIAFQNQVFALTYINNKGAIEEKQKEENIKNITFYYFKLPKFLDFMQKSFGGVQIYAYLWQIKAYFVARKLHKEHNFNLFHHITYANDWMASYIGALLPVPYVRGPGGGAHKVPKSFVNNYSFKQKLAEKIRSIGQWFFKHDPFFIIGQKKAKALLVCNYEAKNAIPKKWQKKVFLFPVNGISLKDFTFQKLPGTDSSKDFSILTAGKLIKIKSFDLAIKAFAIFNKKVNNTKFIIAGEGPEIQNLKNLAIDLGVKNKVIFTGWIKREDLLDKMSSCDVFLFPSLRDGGGNVVVEAMAMGKSVICFDLAGPGFHIDESCGIKIKPENPEQAVKDMAQALEKLYLDKDLILKLGQGARKKAEKEYDWDKLGDRLIEIYKKVL
jgi:glycosyltransferase involved in cell wall biosynthesis